MLPHRSDEEIEARSQFEAVLFGRMILSAFAEWVYMQPDLAQIVGYADEEELLAFNYQANNSLTELRRLLRDIYQRWWPGPESIRVLWRSEVVDLAERTLQQTISLPRAARLMTEFATDQIDTYEHSSLFQPFWDFYAEYAYLSTMTDEIDMAHTVSSQSKDKLLQLERQYRSSIEESCRQILNILGAQ
jgi:hypothetical protein